MYFRPYSEGSVSAKSVFSKLALPSTRYKKDTPKNCFVINWGSIKQAVEGCVYLNHPDNVKIARNKLKTFRRLREVGVSIPNFTTSYEEALNFRVPIVERELLTGTNGVGIKVINNLEELSQTVPLYVYGLKKRREFRVIVVRGEVIVCMKKGKRAITENSSFIWNEDKGYFFEDVRVDEKTSQEQLKEVKNQAIKAVEALGLDFGGVDIVQTPLGSIKVLEVNTAMGLGERNSQLLADVFKNIIENL